MNGFDVQLLSWLLGGVTVELMERGIPPMPSDHKVSKGSERPDEEAKE